MYYLIPSPAWDYGGIWHSIQETKQTVEELLKNLQISKAQRQRVTRQWESVTARKYSDQRKGSAPAPQYEKTGLTCGSQVRDTAIYLFRS